MNVVKKKTLELLLLNENTKTVWNALCFSEPSSYGDLVYRTGLSRSTLYDALSRLEKEGFVKRLHDKPEGGKSGRPKTRWIAI